MESPSIKRSRSNGRASMRKNEEYDALSEVYDILWPGVNDLSFYLELAKTHGSPILELGCGTGRLACELARLGFRTTGIDISPRMLERAEARKASLSYEVQSLVEFELLSMTEFHLRRRFGLILAPFSTMFELSSAEERAATYCCCIKHLKDGGALIIDNWFKGEGQLADWGKPRPHGVVTFLGDRKHPSQSGTRIQHFEAQEYGSDGLMELTIFVDELNTENTVHRKTFKVTRRYAHPDQTLEELEMAGFDEIDVYGGFNREELYDPNLRGRGRQIFVAQQKEAPNGN